MDAFNNASALERAQVLRSFHAKKGDLPDRRMTYVDAAKKVLVRRPQRRESLLISPASGAEPVMVSEKETTPSRVPVSNDADWNAGFEKDLELALATSLESRAEGKVV
jgi:hypothetical protein